jgi:SPOR domain
MQPTWPPAQDPRGYDLGNYMPTNGAGHGDPHMAPGQHQQPHPAQQWPAQGAYGSEPGEPSLDTAHYGAPQQDTQLAPHDPRYAEADEYEEAEDEEPGRGRRGLMIVAALVGAIALGGGLAYAYKTFGSRLIAGNKSAPVVKAPVDANKAKPATPGGKEFAHTDKKLLNERVGADGQPLNFAAAPESPAASQMSAAIQAVGKSGDNDPSGARAVRTITITPPGNAAAPPPVAVPPPQPPAAAPQPLVTSAAPAAPTKLVTAAAPTAPPKAAPSPPAAPVAEPKAEPKKAAVPIARAGAPTEPASGVGGPAAGFVAVILSRTTKVDAMKGFADLQQKYAEVLGSKPAEVKEANLGDKGVWYRAVVGPPGSRDAANTVCNQLKTAGFTGCWVSTY